MTGTHLTQYQPTLGDSWLLTLADEIDPESDDASLPWQPNPDNQPQQLAYYSEADVTGFGGAAGGGKSDLLLGLAMTQHRKSIIFRRHYTDLGDMVTRGDEIQSGKCAFVWGIKRRWNTPGGRQIELGAVQHDKDKKKYRGRPNDFIGIDEAADFPEPIYRFLTSWLRTSVPGQRTRIVLAFNPPTTIEGDWIIQYFAPWLDDSYLNPAQPGELRWYIRSEDEDIEVPDSTPIEMDGEMRYPKSRTFIPARVEDNPFFGDDYIAQLDSLPEPLRSQLRYGQFNQLSDDDPWQVIPTAWILAAQKRWQEMGRPDVALRAVGVDVARGGKDRTAISRLYGSWFDEIVTYSGKASVDGPTVAQYVREAHDGIAPVGVDVIGYGASAYDALKSGAEYRVTGVNNSSATKRKDKSRKYKFLNIRAASYWLLRESLDPESGQEIALPPDRQIRTELAAPRYSVLSGKIKIEDKQNIIKRTGRSPDLADAIVLAWWIGNRPIIVGGFDLSTGKVVS